MQFEYYDHNDGKAKQVVTSAPCHCTWSSLYTVQGSDSSRVKTCLGTSTVLARPSTTIRMCRTKSTAVKKLSSQHKQPCTALKCAKCLQAGQRPDRKGCSTLGCPCKCPRFIGIPTQRLQKGEQQPVRMCTRSQTMIKKDTGLTTADATPFVLTASTRRSSTSSTNMGGVSSMSSSSDEGEMEGEILKASLQTYSIPGSLLAAGATPLAITLQHCANAGSVMILAHPIS